MHPSYFLMINANERDPKRELSLAPEMSEWLFYADFWKSVNRKLGLNFGQYEDDVLPKEDIAAVLEVLEKCESDLVNGHVHVHDVLYGWTAQGKSLMFQVTNDVLTTGAAVFRNFLRNAMEFNSHIYCQLQCIPK